MIRLALSQSLCGDPTAVSGFTYEGRSLSSLQTQFGLAEQGRKRPATIPTDGLLLEIIDKMLSKQTRLTEGIAIHIIIFFILLQRSFLFLISHRSHECNSVAAKPGQSEPTDCQSVFKSSKNSSFVPRSILIRLQKHRDSPAAQWSSRYNMVFSYESAFYSTS